MEIIEDVFQMDRKECEDQEGMKMCRRKSMPERGRCFCMGYVTLSGPVAVDEERLEATARNSAEKRGRKKMKKTSQGSWPGGARRSSFWLCYAGTLAERQKSEIFGKQRRPNSLEEEQLGKFGEKEIETATEQRRKYTNLGLDLDEREEQVACRDSALALAMTDKAHREAEM